MEWFSLVGLVLLDCFCITNSLEVELYFIKFKIAYIARIEHSLYPRPYFNFEISDETRLWKLALGELMCVLFREEVNGGMAAAAEFLQNGPVFSGNGLWDRGKYLDSIAWKLK